MMQKQILKITQLILIPFGLLYGIILQIRNWLYDWGIFKSASFDVPIISVGNITVGGTGKTPFVLFLAKNLADKYQKIAIVSRGYGRKSSGLQIVSAKNQIFMDALQAGDEPFQIARALPESYVIVSEKRAEGVRLAIEKFQADLIILDDAFQHRAVKRDLDILLVNAREPWRNNFPIPAGSLREFKYNYKRAQIIVFTNTDSNTKLLFEPEKQPFFKSSPRLKEVLDLENRVVGTVSDFQSKKVLAFAGIAHPQNFEKALTDAGVRVLCFSGFSDHYEFTEKNLQKLFMDAQKYECELLLCTEKDLGKIQTLKLYEFPLPVLAVRMSLSFDDEEKLIRTVNEQVNYTN